MDKKVAGKQSSIGSTSGSSLPPAHPLAVPAKTAVKKSTQLRQIVTIVLLVVLVFGAGVGVGNGKFMFHRSNASVSGLPDNLDYSSVNTVYKSLKDNYNGKLTETQVLDGMKSGLAASAKDPYTEYFNTADAKSFGNKLNNTFSGIGAELGKDDSGNLIVVSPISGFPADKAGLKAQDIITSIDGASTTDMSIDDAVGKIHGTKGTKVTLKIVRNKSDAMSITITRDTIQIPSVTSKVLNNNIGYIQIVTFADDTSSLIKQAADKMKQTNVKGIILDLRGNPGGEVNAAVDVSSEWLPAGKSIMQEKRGSTIVQSYTSTGADTLVGIPTVVLIDKGSASASEITAGALHDNKAATLIGTQSYGKGVVQQLINLGDGSELKVTIASWYRPNGQNINKKGITPDQVVTEPTDATPDNDPQLQAATAFLNK
jgi:carboxyl-terminal processing protease